MAKLPNNMKMLFWDVRFSEVDTDKSPKFIIKRVLDRSNLKHVKWLFNNFTSQEIIDVIMISRDLSALSANFWALFYNLDKSKIPALQKPFDPIPWGAAS